MELHRLPPYPANCATPGPTHSWGSTQGLRSGIDRSGCCEAWARVPEVAQATPEVPGASWPRTQRAHSQAAAAAAAEVGKLRAERKPRAQTGRGGWCERLGPVPARRGWNTMSRAGGRAGNENSLTQQLGKWVCSLTRLTALAACGQLRPTLGGSLQREGRAHCRLLGSRPCLPLARDLHVAGWRIPLPSRPFTKASNSPQPEQSGLYPLRRCILFTRPGRCGGAYGCWIHVTFPPNLTTLEGL